MLPFVRVVDNGLEVVCATTISTEEVFKTCSADKDVSFFQRFVLKLKKITFYIRQNQKMNQNVRIQLVKLWLPNSAVSEFLIGGGGNIFS